MFKFGFGDQEAKTPETQVTDTKDLSIAAFEVTHDASATIQPNQMYDHLNLCDGAITLRKVTTSVPSHLSPSGADIVPTTYEGGFKVWECALDLCAYIHNHLQSQLKGKSVLELGAGHALPTIVAAQHAPSLVHIHDYNSEVIHQVSMPNFSANDSANTPVRYFAGAWSSLPSVFSIRHDVIFSAETTYATQQCKELASCIIETLADNGVAYIAGKSYYFGVGGGTISFRKDILDYAKEKSVHIDVDVVEEFRDGISNVREILRVRRS